MAFGLQIWDAAANLVFDSTTAVGGVPAGVWSGGAGTLSFPEFAGLTMEFVTLTGLEYDEWGEVTVGGGVSVSHASGYPVVTVASWAPTFMLAVF